MPQSAEFAEAVLAVFGGIGGAILIVGWLARAIAKHWLAKDLTNHQATLSASLARDLETHKDSLSAASAAATSQLRHALELVGVEHQIRYSKLHERRAAVIELVYEKLVEFEWAGHSLVGAFEFHGEPSKADKYVAAMNKSAEFYRTFEKSRIYLPDSLCQKIDTFVREMRKRVIEFGAYNQTNEHAPDHVAEARVKKWIEALEYFDAEVPGAKRALEEELRQMLGDVSANPVASSLSE